MPRDDVSSISSCGLVHELTNGHEIAAWAAHIFDEERGLPIRLVDEWKFMIFAGIIDEFPLRRFPAYCRGNIQTLCVVEGDEESRLETGSIGINNRH